MFSIFSSVRVTCSPKTSNSRSRSANSRCAEPKNQLINKVFLSPKLQNLSFATFKTENRNRNKQQLNKVSQKSFFSSFGSFLDKARSMSSPWKTPERPQAQSFRELMQEQKEDEVNNAEDRDIAMALKLSMEENLSVEER
jgi:hypothetical protein